MKILNILLCISLVACSSTSLKRKEVLINAKIPTAKNEKHDFFKEYCKEGRQISAVGAQAIIHLPNPSKGMLIDKAAKLKNRYISRAKKRLKDLFFQSSLERSYSSRSNSFVVVNKKLSEDLFNDSSYFNESETDGRTSKIIAIFEDGAFHIGTSFPSVFKINHNNLENQGSTSYLDDYIYVIDREHQTINTVLNYSETEPNVDYGEVWVRKSKEVQVLPMYPAHLDFMRFFREKYVLKLPIKLRERFGMPKRNDLSDLLHGSDRDWELFLRAVTSYKQSVSEDGTQLYYLVGIDLNPFCKYGIQKQGFLVK
jgi:hypothetical protein